MEHVIDTEEAPKPVGPYSQGVRAGKFLFVSGQLAIDPKEGKIIEGGVEEQTSQTLKNIRAILQAAGYTLEDVVSSNVYLTTMAHFAKFNKIYARYFKRSFPARVTAVVELIPRGLVEISVIAYRE